MGVFLNLIDAILIFFFAVIAICAPLLDSQTCLPTTTLHPKAAVDFYSWYARKYGDYLVEEKPDFYVGLVWLQLLFQWPLSLLNLYAILGGKSWLRTTCLISGVYTFTATAAILSDMAGSQKPSNELFMIYYPFMVFAVLAILRGLLPYSGKTTSAERKIRID